MKEFCALRAKTYSYLMDDNSEVKKSKGTKKCVIKRRLMFENYKDSLFNNKTILKSQLRFKSDHHNMYTEEVNKNALNSNDDKRLQTIDRVTKYTYGTNAFKLCESKMLSKIRCNVQIINLDSITNETNEEHNKNWPYIPDHPYRILIIGGSGSGKTNLLLNLIENQPDIDKIYLYVKDPYESKYQYSINNKREGVGINNLNNIKAFIEY